MTERSKPVLRIDRLRGLIMFVIAWLVGLSVFNIVSEVLSSEWGVALAVLSAFANLYARHKVIQGVQGRWARWFWEKMPLVLFFGLPLVIRLVSLIWRPAERGWWPYFQPILALVFKLAVPVAVLFYVYVVLGRLRPATPAPDASATPPTPAPAPAETPIPPSADPAADGATCAVPKSV